MSMWDYPEKFKRSIAAGQPFTRVYEGGPQTGPPGPAQYPSNAGVDLGNMFISLSESPNLATPTFTAPYTTFTPWGIAVGPSSEIDTFALIYTDVLGNSNVIYFDNKTPLIGIIPAQQVISGSYIYSSRIGDGFTAGTMQPYVDLIVYWKPWPIVPRHRAMLGLTRTGFVANGAGNAVLRTQSLTSALWGRKKLSITGGCTTAATIRFDVFSTYFMSRGFAPPNDSQTNPLLFTYTTTGLAADSFSAEVGLSGNIGGPLIYVVTKTAGAAGAWYLDMNAYD